MAKLKTGLSGLNPTALASKADSLETALTGNVDFPTPEPAIADITAKRTELQSWIAQSRFRDERAINKRNMVAEELLTMLRTLAKYVAFTADGDRSMILSSGFAVVKQREPMPPLAQPADLAASRGSHQGRIMLDWKAVKGSLNYLVEITTEDPALSNPNWAVMGYTSKSKFQADNLIPGTKYWFRVKSLGARDESAFSDPALIMAA
jgi:hypothetical protein